MSVPALEDRDGRVPLGELLGIEAFAMDVWRTTASGSVIPDHDERAGGHEELFVVLAGSARFTLDDRQLDAPQGTLVHVADPDPRRSARTDAPGTVVLAVSGKPGAAYTVPRSNERHPRAPAARRHAPATAFSAAAFDELESIPVAEGLVWHPIRRRFDIRAFGVNAYTADAIGGHVVERHTEEQLGHEEVYIVLRGRACFVLDTAEHDATAGTAVFIDDPRVKREAVAEEPGTLVLAVGGKPGMGFEVSAWETMFYALPAMHAERWEDAIALHEAALREHPGHPALLYNLACIESRSGRSLDALLHLQQAAAAESRWVTYAQTDSDLDSIRREQGFPRP